METYFSSQLWECMHPSKKYMTSYTAEEFAILLNSIGSKDFNANRIKNLLTGRVIPSFDTLIRIALVTDIPITELIIDKQHPFAPYDLYDNGHRPRFDPNEPGLGRLEQLRRYEALSSYTATTLRFFQIAIMLEKATGRQVPSWATDASRNWQPLQQLLDEINEYWGTLYSLEVIKAIRKDNKDSETIRLAQGLRDLGEFALLDQGNELVSRFEELASLLGEPSGWTGRFGRDTAWSLESVRTPTFQSTNKAIAEDLTRRLVRPVGITAPLLEGSHLADEHRLIEWPRQERFKRRTRD